MEISFFFWSIFFKNSISKFKKFVLIKSFAKVNNFVHIVYISEEIKKNLHLNLNYFLFFNLFYLEMIMKAGKLSIQAKNGKWKMHSQNGNTSQMISFIKNQKEKTEIIGFIFQQWDKYDQLSCTLESYFQKACNYKTVYS